jgi:hypothetical protein
MYESSKLIAKAAESLNVAAEDLLSLSRQQISTLTNSHLQNMFRQDYSTMSDVSQWAQVDIAKHMWETATDMSKPFEEWSRNFNSQFANSETTRYIGIMGDLQKTLQGWVPNNITNSTVNNGAVTNQISPIININGNNLTNDDVGRVVVNKMTDILQYASNMSR